jgi:GNAT superfamily N-acetyltransferase
MALATWWTTDPLPDAPYRSGFGISRTIDDAALASLNGIPVDEVVARRAAGHRAYVGFIEGVPVTYGWVATLRAEIGELGLRFSLPGGDRYLWDFATLPEWQGRGLYPQLLRAILTAESATGSRFWIIHAPENLPSGAGMRKAGFAPVGRLSFGADGRVALTATGPADRARAGAALLGVPLVGDGLSPCWRCRTEGGQAGGCACCAPASAHETCACATQVRPSQPDRATPAGTVAVI